jgi:hypothetical protein
MDELKMDELKMDELKMDELKMDDLKMPELIDTLDIPEVPLKKVYRQKSEFVGEYVKDTEKLIIKTNIMNMILMMDECDEPIEIKKMSNMLKNMIILHGKVLKTMPECIVNIERALKIQKLCYDVFVLYKLLHNIKFNTVIDNIHFRYIDENIQQFPPIVPEDRKILENKIKYMRFSYQVKKKNEAFKVGQIVGARDKEHKWWLSRVLHVYDDQQKSGFWYYIRFEGWGELHDEWIYSDTYRVRWYNPRKHYLKK